MTITTEDDSLLSSEQSLDANAFDYNDLLRAQRGRKQLRAQGALQQLRAQGGTHNLADATDPEEAGGGGDAHGHDAHGHDSHGHDAPLAWYAPPVQRQRWGEEQEHAHVPWTDLFYDLFYVAAAYNMGKLMTTSLTPDQYLRGIIYFVAVFSALWGTWETPMIYAARYATNDFVHHAVESLRMLFVALSICFVTKVKYFGDPGSGDAMMFILFILLEFLINLGLNLELYFKGVGDRVPIQNHTMAEIKMYIVPTLLMYLAAFILAVIYYRQPKSDGGHNMGASLFGPAPANGDEYESKKQPLMTAHDIPLILLFVAATIKDVYGAWRKKRATSGKHGALRDLFVPENIDYMVHRYGEWMMLMLGEAIISLATADVVHKKEYYFVLVFGILTMMTIAAAKFGDEPSHGKHAMWKGLGNQISYSMLTQVLSLSLIAFGASYKLLMKDVLKGDAAALSYGEGYSKKDAITPEWAAGFFSDSLGVVILSLQLLGATHKGLTHAFKSCSRIPVLVVGILQWGLCVWAFNLQNITVEPHALTIFGFVIAVLLYILRGVEIVALSSGEVGDDEARTDLRYWRLIQTTVSSSSSSIRTSLLRKERDDETFTSLL